MSKGHGACRVCLRVLDRTDAAAVASALFPGASASQQSRPKAFAAPQGPSTQGGAPMSHYQFQPIETQSGAVTVGLQYAQGLRLSLPKPVAAATGALRRAVPPFPFPVPPPLTSR